MALPKQNRLRSSRDFDKVHRNGLKAATDHLALRAWKPKALPKVLTESLTLKPKAVSAKELNAKTQGVNSPSDNAQNINAADVKRLDVKRLDIQCLNTLNPSTQNPDKPRNKSESADDVSSALSSCFGISISRKVSKRAVIRNRIKRQISAIIQRNLRDIEPGWQIVIVVRPSAVECEFDDFLRELEYLLKKLKITEAFHGY